MGVIQRGRSFLMVFVIVALGTSGVFGQVSAQDDPFGENSFISPKFGTEIEWSEDWVVDTRSSAIEQRRDLLVLISSTLDAGIFVELHSQRTYRTALSLMDAFITRQGDVEILEQDRDAYPPTAQFVSGEDDEQFSVHVQAQAVDGAMMVVAVLGAPDVLEEAIDIASETVTIAGMAMFDALPICGSEGSTTPATETTRGGGSKTGPSGGNATPQASACVDVFVPTPGTGNPTPTAVSTGASGKSGGVNDATYQAPTFDVSLRYNKTRWIIREELEAADNDGRDLIQLAHTEYVATLFIESYEGYNGRASACIDLALGEAGITPGRDDVVLDDDGNAIQGSTQGRVWGAYDYYSNGADLTSYVECRALPKGAGVVVISMISTPEDFLDAYADLTPILNSIITG